MKQKTRREAPGTKMATGSGAAIKKTFTLDELTLVTLNEVGEGNASEGVRRLAHDWQRRKLRRSHETE